MRIAAIIRGLLVLILATAGCRGSRSDLVEAELRTKDRMLREAQAEVERTRAVNAALEREFMQRQQGLPNQESSAVGSPKSIVIANGTGGVNNGNGQGDEALQVVVVPRDEDGHPVRAIGALSIAAWEIMPGGVKVPLSTWEINATDLRRTWKSGLLGSSYTVVLNWKRLPTQPRLRVAVQLSLPDGRVFEADKDISIHPLPGGQAAPQLEQIMPTGPSEGPSVP